MRFDELAAAFLSAKLHPFRPNTRRAYRTNLTLVARSFRAVDTADLTAAHLQAFLAPAANRASSFTAVKRARASVFCKEASQTPVAMPKPISSWPSRIDRGSPLRRCQPIASAPC